MAALWLLPAALSAQAPGPGEAEAYAAAVASVEAASDSTELATALNNLGLLHWRGARYDSALAHLHRSRALWAELGDHAWLGRSWNNIGAAHYQWGNYELALDAFLRSLSFRRGVGDLRGQGLVLTNVGRTYHDWQQYDRARTILEEAIVMADASGDPFAAGYARHNLGVLHLTLGEHERARALFQSALDLVQADDAGFSDGDRASVWALNQVHLGLVQVREGDVDGGIATLEEVLAVGIEESHPRRQARALVHLGEAYRAADRLDRAVSTLDRALSVSRAAGQRALSLEALAGLASAHEARGDHRAALAHLQGYNALSDSIFNQSAVQRIAAMEARAETERQERENARLQEDRRVREAVIARQRVIVLLGGALLVVTAVLAAALVWFNRTGRRRREQLAAANAALSGTNEELKVALSEVRTLEGLIPICGHCKKVRDDRGFWEGVESYISSRSDARFSHGICAECGPRFYGEMWDEDGAGGVGSAPPEHAGPEDQPE